MSHPHPRAALLALAPLLLFTSPAAGFDGNVSGMSAGGGGLQALESAAAPTYYEGVLEDPAGATVGASHAGLPASLHVVDAAGRAEYRALGADGSGSDWELLVEIEARPHERIEAVYDLVLALALPEDFASKQWRIVAREGTERASVPVVYGGEKVALKRNVALETAWLPLLAGSPDGLPDLAGSGYAWTLWDAVLHHDPAAGDALQGFARFRYSAGPAVRGPDPEDPDNAAFVISWIPTLDPGIPPFTLRLDVVSAAE